MELKDWLPLGIPATILSIAFLLWVLVRLKIIKTNGDRKQESPDLELRMTRDVCARIDALEEKVRKRLHDIIDEVGPRLTHNEINIAAHEARLNILDREK